MTLSIAAPRPARTRCTTRRARGMLLTLVETPGEPARIVHDRHAELLAKGSLSLADAGALSAALAALTAKAAR